MGLDIALGIVILIGAIRGWFRGFLLPAIRLASLVGCVYAAAPIREYARPHVVPYLTTVPAARLDQLLWWLSAFTAFVVVTGLSGLIIAMQRRKPAFGEPDANRADQFAGMLLGATQAAVVAAFVVAGLDQYARQWAETIPWADRQAKTSRALVLQADYHPAERIWTSPPVRQFVAHVHRMGIATSPRAGAESNLNPGADSDAAPVAEIAPVQTAASRAPRLALPEPPEVPSASADDFLHAFDQAIERLDRHEPRR